jgi:hypothetical protein
MTTNKLLAGGGCGGAARVAVAGSGSVGVGQGGAVTSVSADLFSRAKDKDDARFTTLREQHGIQWCCFLKAFHRGDAKLPPNVHRLLLPR